MWFYMRDWLFIARFFNIHQNGVLTALAWLVPHETAAVSAQVLCIAYNHAPCHLMQSHIRKVYACLTVTCHLHFWQNDRDLLRATAVTWGWTDTKIRVSTESQPWRRKFSHHSCRCSNHWAIPTLLVLLLSCYSATAFQTLYLGRCSALLFKPQLAMCDAHNVLFMKRVGLSSLSLF